jgi:exodeoxyribonuclease V beta subunit
VRRLDVDAVALGGTQLVEASAGTGKTFAIAHLFLRLLLEPEGRAELEPRDLLVVTYTKAAAAELRARIRRRLREALAALRGADPADEVLGAFVARRRCAGQAETDAGHLERCLRGLDQAAICTIHAFCQRALADAAFRSAADFDVELLEDARPLLREIARDFWVSRLAEAPAVFVDFLHEHDEHKLGPERLARLAERIAAQPLAEIVPEYTEERPPEVPAEWHAALAALARLWPAAREQVRELLLAPGVMNRGIFKPEKVDAWLAQLDAALGSPRPGISWRTELERLSDAYVRAKTTTGAVKPEHPLFAACSRLVEIERALERALAASARSLLLEFAAGLRGELARRLRARGLQGFDDLLLGLQRALRAEGGDALAAELAQRHVAALIDESQDTDPVQYEIFRRVWHDARAPLFLIGDPKQAIYSFRGADVHAYLAAREAAESRLGLDVSRRSDPSLLRALNTLFGEGPADPFGLEGGAYRPLEPRTGARDELAAPAFEVLLAQAPDQVAAGVAAEITALLADPPRLGSERLRASDVAVLCRTNEQAREVRDALHQRGVSAVLQGDASVFQSDAAEDVERIARALAHPGDARRLRAALATPLLGVDAPALDAMLAGAPAWDEWQDRVRDAHDTWRELGFSVALRGLLDASRGSGRLLAELGGERRLTDALQLGELMHLAERKLHLGPLGAVRWLSAERSGAPARGAADWIEDAQIRLESDGDAVRLTTVHRSKGLEYGVVYVPFAWKSDELRPEEKRFVRFHRGAGRIAFDLGSPDAERAAHRALAEREARSEAMRLLYVALTRARHGCRVVYAEARGAEATALGRLLGAVQGEPLGDRLRRWSSFGARPLAAAQPLVRVAAAEPAPVLPARALRRPPGVARRTSSYTGLVRRARAESAGRDHDADVAAGEGEALARGISVGLALHEVLEHLDFPGAEPRGVGRAVERASALHGVDPGAAAALVRVVLGVIDTPLSPDGTLRLRDVARAERASELEFLLPVGDARAEATRLTPGRLADAFARHAAPQLREYAGRLRELDFTPLVGHLRGYVDLVFRHSGRWYLVDYKSNALDDYGPDRLRAAMFEHHYVLQYHLYALALHRWLERRVAGYAYERDFGGVHYLFARGMSPRRPGSGVWFDRPPLALIDALGGALSRSGGAA